MTQDAQETEVAVAITRRRVVVLSLFVLFAFVVLAFVYQVQRQYTENQCLIRVEAVRQYNQTYDDLARLERANKLADPAIRDERVRIYLRARLPVPSC